MTDFLASLYNTDRRDRADFGSAWCGPDTLTHGEDVVIARYPKGKNSDGYNVTVTCCALPARCYSITAEPSPDSCGDPRPGFTLSTGSGVGAWVAETARLISEGMIGVRP